MTPDIAEIQKRLEEATQAGWYLCKPVNPEPCQEGNWDICAKEAGDIHDQDFIIGTALACDYSAETARANGELMVHAPDDIRKLLTQLSAAQATIDKLPRIVRTLCERRELTPCFFNRDGDCGNWPTCQEDCPIRRLREMVGIIAQEDGGIDQQEAAAEAAAKAKEGKS